MPKNTMIEDERRRVLASRQAKQAELEALREPELERIAKAGASVCSGFTRLVRDKRRRRQRGY